MNIYLLTNHLSPADTQNLLVIAATLGVAGLALVNPVLLGRLYALMSRLFGSQATASVEYAPRRK
ncbi:MAG: hypothetical protein KGH79_04780 [Patescibacteria group bacterium]|nr:hypothetical protein [Patescibacteria group bacterium]